MAKYLVVADEEYKAYVKEDAICMFRMKTGNDGAILEHESAEVEITFVGGAKTKLIGQSAWHFITAMTDLMGGI